MKDPFIQKKYARERRIKEKSDYIDRHLPEIKAGGKTVLDIGPGPGEFLELCRFYDNKIFGIDAKVGDCEMGNEYLVLSQLMSERQELDIKYSGFENILLSGRLPLADESVDVINSQGSIEQVFKNYMDGPPHVEHHDCMKLSWRLNHTFLSILFRFFSETGRITKQNGVFLIYANGSKNHDDFMVCLLEAAEGNGFEVLEKYSDKLFKLRKTQV